MQSLRRRVWAARVFDISFPDAFEKQFFNGLLGQTGPGETMILLRQGGPAVNAAHKRLSGAVLTPRETEVLSWLAKGKTNRDIADILGMSPRTVNKHLEHIFEKLGVETRTAAAAIASSLLQDA